MNPTHESRRLHLRRWLTIGTSALVAVALAVPVVSWAANPAIILNLGQTDGTAPFDTADGPGLDSSASNGIVRVNDTLTYQVEVGINGTQSSNTTFVIELPRGVELTSLPVYCSAAGSGVSPQSLGVPAVPLTSSSYLSLPRQTLTCNLGDQPVVSTFTYPLTVKIRPEVPNGTQLDPALAVGHSDQVPEPVTSNQVTATTSAALKWDLSMNGVSLQPNTGAIFGPAAQTCPWDVSLSCYLIQYPMMLSAPIQGKGSAPAVSPITFSADLTPAALWPSLTPTQLGEIDADPAKYGARLGVCRQSQQVYEVPQSRIGRTPTASAAQSVRDSGTAICSQAGPGQRVSVILTRTDTSLYTYPTTTQTINGGTGAAIPANRAYATSLQMQVYVPIATVKDFGVSVGGVQSLSTRNSFTDLNIQGLDGAELTTAGQDLTNDYRTTTPTVRPAGKFDIFYVGVPGTANNTSLTDYSQSGWFEGPPGGATLHSGSITVSPSQTAISEMTLGGADLSNPVPVSVIGCDTWDSSALQLAAGNYPASQTAYSAIPSGGRAVWLSGFNAVPNPATPGVNTYARNAGQLPPYQVQYSTAVGGTGADSRCDTGTWYDDPAAVPGNNATLASHGIYSAVSRVRVWVSLPVPSGTNTGGGSQPTALAAVALRVVDSATPGLILPNWGGAAFTQSASSMETMLADSTLTWRTSSYNASNNSGGLGDRLTATPAYARISTLVKGPNDAGFSATPPSVTGGLSVQYQLSPSLTSAITVPGVTKPVWVEDCLAAGQQLTSASITPNVVVVGGTPGDAHYHCPRSTDTYLRWNLGSIAPNSVLPPIVMDVAVSTLAHDGTYDNDTQIWAQDDYSLAHLRQSSAQIQVINPTGVKLELAALTPVTQLNRVGQTTSEANGWALTISNVNGPETLSDPDVIDHLPAIGDPAGSAFNGTSTFKEAVVQSGGPDVELLYTGATSLNVDPNDPSNADDGSTPWCNGPADGDLILGVGTCPTAAAEVTGLRVRRPGAFAPGDEITVSVWTVGDANQAGDIYSDSAFARVAGRVTPLGPLYSPESVISGSLGDRVWTDEDGDGIQDSGEPPIAGFPVTLTGTDDLGNSVTDAVTTGPDGHYAVTGLRAGDYHLTFDLAALTTEQTFSPALAGADRAVDSDADPATGTTGTLILAPGAHDTDADQGVIPAFGDVVVHADVVDPTPTAPGRPSTIPATVSCVAPGHPDTEITVSNLALPIDGTPAAARVETGSHCVVAASETNGATAVVDPVDGLDVPLDEIAATVFLTYQPVLTSVAVHAVVDDPTPSAPGRASTFGAELSCAPVGGGAADVRALTLSADGTVVTADGILYGSSCTLAVTDNGGAESAVISPAGTLHTGISTVEATATFSYPPVTTSVTAQTIVDDPEPGTEGRAASYPVMLSCVHPGDTTPTISTAVLDRDGSPVTIDGIYLGSSCTISETDANGARVRYDPAGAVVVAGGESFTVHNAYGPELSSVTISAQIIDPTPAANRPSSVDAELTCLAPDATESTVVPVQLPVGAAAQTVPDVLVGSVCSVSVSDVAHASTSVDPAGDFVVESAGAAVGITRQFAAATSTLTVHSLVEDPTPAAGGRAATLAAQLSCVEPGDTTPSTVDVAVPAGGSSAVSGLLVGSSCSVTVDEVPGAVLNIDPANPFTITEEDGDASISAHYAPALASIGLVKIVSDPTPLAPGRASTFPVTVTCIDPDGVTVTEYNVVLSKDGTPALLSGLFVGAQCTFVETDSDGATPSYSGNGTVVVADGSTVMGTVVNQYAAADPTTSDASPSDPTGESTSADSTTADSTTADSTSAGSASSGSTTTGSTTTGSTTTGSTTTGSATSQSTSGATTTTLTATPVDPNAARSATVTETLSSTVTSTTTAATVVTSASVAGSGSRVGATVESHSTGGGMPLATTGIHPGPLLWTAFGLVGAGFMLLRSGRQRAVRHTSRSSD